MSENPGFFSYSAPIEEHVDINAPPPPYRPILDADSKLVAIQDAITGEVLPATLNEWSWKINNSADAELRRGYLILEQELRSFLAKYLFKIIWPEIEIDNLVDLRLAGIEEKGPENPFTDSIQLKNAIDMLKQDCRQEVDNYLAHLATLNTTVRFSELKVDGFNQVRHYAIGDYAQPFPEKTWNAPLIAVKHVKDFLGEFKRSALPNKLPITIFEFFDLSPSIAIQTRRGTFTKAESHLMQMTSSTGYASDFKLAVLHSSQQDSATDSAHSLNTAEADNTLKHELSHMLDPFIQHAGLVQAEAFATMRELSGDFKAAIKLLREQRAYQLPLTLQKACTLFKRNLRQPEYDSPFTSVEQYDLSACIFCYIYEKLGPQRFIEFYGLITGGMKVNRDGETVDTKSSDEQTIQVSFRDDLMGAFQHKLGEIGSEQSASDLLQTAVDQINAATLSDSDLFVP